MSDWGPRLDTLMRALGMSYRKAAPFLGVCIGTLQRIRAWGGLPTFKMVHKIIYLETVYAREIEEFRRTGKPSPPKPTTRPLDLAEMGNPGSPGPRGPASGPSNPGAPRSSDGRGGAFASGLANPGHPAFQAGLTATRKNRS